MKMKLSYGLAVILLAITVWTVGPTIAQNVACYKDQGGAAWHLGSGCTQTGESGGILNVASGGALKIAGTDKTAAIAGLPATTNYAVGVAASYKIARGVTALDGSNPTPAATGLTTIVACTTSIAGTASPDVGTSIITVNINGTSIDLYAWKVTNSSTTSLIASTGTENIHWICVGT
jgi:hypothetical protein